MHEEALHLPQAEPAALTQLRHPADGVWQRVVNDLGSLAGQGVDRQASKSARRSIWRKRRGQGTPIHERDTQK